MKRNSLSKLLRRIACALAALVIALAVAVFALWHNELTTLASFQKLSDRDEAHRDGAVYQINFSGDYFFDEFLSQGGASNDAELISFITRSITKGIIPMHIKTSSIACSALRRTSRAATGSLAATTISRPPIRPSSIRIPARAAMPPTPPSTWASSASTRTRTWRPSARSS